ncbi:MAG: hypothetical protein K0S33_2446 [Bacteroidetes bacterium]|jgi:hypothetical protein|nr:hypothetical protein [Bacteroidota bacterium]
MFKFKKIVFLFAAFIAIQAKAQKFTSFSEDSVKYIKELDAYFQDNTANKDEAKKFVEDFGRFWKTPAFTKEYKESVYEISNKMLVKKLKPYPYFRDYLTAVANYIDAGKDREGFLSWQACLEKSLAAKNNKAFGELLETSLNLFEANIFFHSPAFDWYSVEGEYTFAYDSVPKVVFPKFTLKCRNAREDSLEITDIIGTYYPSSGRFVGKGGKTTWKRTGLDDDVYVDLKKVSIDCKSGGYSCDSVFFHHPDYFEKPQLGKIIDKVITENKTDTYPRFDTYTKRILVKNVLKDVDYEGGFSMRGAKFVGSGDSKNPAKILFRRGGQVFLQLTARNFAMSTDKVTSENASVKFFIDKDSIIHPGLTFKYEADKRKVSLLRTDDGMQKSPYYDSYHKLDMYFEELIWKIDSAKIDMGFLANNFQGQAYFESQDFFTADRYEKLSAGDVNPISKINQYYESNGKQKIFTAKDLAIYMKWLAVDLRPVLFKVAQYGLISFNTETDEVTIKDKLFSYIKAHKKQADYDIITFHSTSPGNYNATLNLLNNNFDLRIRGVKQLLLSDTQQVFVFPAKQEVTVKKGRKCLFSGVVAAGKFEFHGKEFTYDYDLNKIDLKNVDSLRIYVDSREPDINGNYGYKRVQTVIENVNGELLVDGPTNHAGWKKAPSFPIFKSFKESYAYYDKRSIQRGVYNKNKFYFKLDPYTIDSVDNFRNEALIFDGEFVSADIFPTFREKLTLQEDYSLGFIRQTPPGGFQVYGGKAKFENEIRLSNKGLRADGDITFGPSVTHSDDFIFFPDSMNGVAQNFDVKETSSPDEFPQAHGENVYIHWMPYKDLMQASDKTTPFSAYNKQAEFRGRFDLSPSELYGKGKVDFERADLMSKKILFKQKKFFSDTANFHLKAFEEEGFTFSTENVNATINFEDRTGQFVSNGAGSYVRFDKNQYIAYMDRFKWYMDSENIQLGDDQKKIDAAAAENALDLEGPEFISIHPKQDSLRFFAPAATYNLRKYIIGCKNVPFINVADARMFPDSGKVTIYKSAVMDTLRNAVILANTVTKFHNIKKVRANIYGKKSYLASGEYTYYDENNSPFLIKFAKITPDTSGQTVSEGTITEAENFKFNPYFSFAGKVKLFASEQFLTFDGGTKIVHDCGRVSKSYLKFAGEIDPKEIYIPIAKDLKDVNNNEVGSGIIYSNDSTKVYSAFISPVPGRKDKNIISADGFMFYDKEANEYRISSKEKLVENSLPGNYMSLNTTNCIVYGEGLLDIGADFGQVKVVTAGSASHYTVNDSSSLSLMMTVDFFMNKSAMKKMFTDMEVYMGSSAALEFDKPGFEKGLREILGQEKGDKAISDLNLNGGFKRFPDELEKTFFIGDINMRYDKASKSFLSDGKIGIGSVYKNEYYRYVNGYVQIKKQKSGDKLTILLQLDQSTWYYFSYFKGVMSVVSSNQEFNTIIKEEKPKSRKMDVDKGPAYQYNIAGPKMRDKFLKDAKLTIEVKKEEEE